MTPLLGNVVMGATPSHHAVCAPFSKRYVCCSSLSPFALVCSWALPSLANRALTILLHHRSLLLPHLTSHHVLLQHHSILSLLLFLLFHSLLSHLCTMLPALQACRKRLDHSMSLPAENWTCFIKANPHVHCVHTIVHIQLDHCSVTSVSDVWILFIQHNDVSSSDDLWH